MKKQHGFTLIEVMLVLVVVSLLIMLSINYMQQQAQAARIDKTSLQMQQILNAGLAFYIATSNWPSDIQTDLQDNGYLPNIILTNAWGQNYNIMSTPGLFYVYTNIPGSATSSSAYAVGTVLAGKLPLAYTTQTPPIQPNIPDPTNPCIPATTNCYVAASVNIPGQNSNNATSINFAGTYHHGGCVPAPICPALPGQQQMQPKLFLVPTSVSGFNDTASNPNAPNPNAYAITSFTAYPSNQNPQLAGGSQTRPTPDLCPGMTRPNNTCALAGLPAQLYWRACLDIVTEKGNTKTPPPGGTPPAGLYWGLYVSMAAFTRCAPAVVPNDLGLTIYNYSY